MSNVKLDIDPKYIVIFESDDVVLTVSDVLIILRIAYAHVSGSKHTVSPADCKNLSRHHLAAGTFYFTLTDLGSIFYEKHKDDLFRAVSRWIVSTKLGIFIGRHDWDTINRFRQEKCQLDNDVSLGKGLLPYLHLDSSRYVTLLPRVEEACKAAEAEISFGTWPISKLHTSYGKDYDSNFSVKHQ